MSSELLLSSSLIKLQRKKFKTPLTFPSKLNLNQVKVEQKETDLLSYLNDVPLCSSHSTKGSECSDHCLSPNEEKFELPCKGVLIIDALKRSNDIYIITNLSDGNFIS